MADDAGVTDGVDAGSRASGTEVVRGTERPALRVGLVGVPAKETARVPETGLPIALPGGTEVVRGTERPALRVGLVGVPAKETARVPETGRPIALPGGSLWRRDPRLRADYIDTHVRAVAYGPLEDYYLLWCEGAPMSYGVHWRLVDFRQGHGTPASFDVHPTMDRAFRAQEVAEFERFAQLSGNTRMSRSQPVSDALARAQDRGEFYSFFQIHDLNAFVCPTRFTSDSAPRTLDLMRGAVEMKVAQVTAELTALKRTIVFQGAARAVFSVASPIVQRIMLWRLNNSPPMRRALIVGPERATEFARAERLRAQGYEVTAVNPSKTPAATAFQQGGGQFKQGRIQDLDPAARFDHVEESFPQPLGKTLAGVQEVKARFERVAPGGRLKVVTEDRELSNIVSAEATARGFKSTPGSKEFMSVQAFKAGGGELPPYIEAAASQGKVDGIWVLDLVAPLSRSAVPRQ